MIEDLNEMTGLVNSHYARRCRRISALTGTLAVVTQVCAVAFHSVALAAVAFALLACSSWFRQARFIVRHFLACK